MDWASEVGAYTKFEDYLKRSYKVPETFEGQERPEYLVRTNTKYSRIPVTYLDDRGIKNRLLDSLLCCLPDGALIAGGFMTAVMGENTDAKDIDLFFTSEKAFKETVKRLVNPEEIDGYNKEEHWAFEGYSPDEDTQKAIIAAATNEAGLTAGEALSFKSVRFLKFVHSHRPPIQLIKLVWYDNAEHVIDSFDLTVAQFACDPKTSEIVLNPAAILDLARKRIVLHRMQFPASTMRRVIKYTNKGYYACPGALVKIAEAIFKTYKEGEEQIVYLD